ncbi:hypothetical protein M4951_10500 [Blastopirellula sp. J2-11]|uniref:hypothetical protein n=1 Tax=Blastopirellula sp. J2-11 TaxID=2943192 RepID=UPI0021C79F5B|nr:hypothetical protein [Blastopirellula sp. J2-11]UUO08725.1 hypothetical protein M4951_10500 [Blastopirellula sp. J2-11]
MRYILTTICLLGLISGCSSGGRLETAAVTGKVTYQGKPLPYGSISFRPEAGSPAYAKIKEDGTYSLSTFGNGDGAIVGKHQVLIVATEADAGVAPANNSGIEMPVTKSVIPQKYASFSTSKLTAEVISGKSNEFSFTLVD